MVGRATIPPFYRHDDLAYADMGRTTGLRSHVEMTSFPGSCSNRQPEDQDGAKEGSSKVLVRADVHRGSCRQSRLPPPPPKRESRQHQQVQERQVSLANENYRPEADVLMAEVNRLISWLEERGMKRQQRDQETLPPPPPDEAALLAARDGIMAAAAAVKTLEESQSVAMEDCPDE